MLLINYHTTAALGGLTAVHLIYERNTLLHPLPRMFNCKLVHNYLPPAINVAVLKLILKKNAPTCQIEVTTIPY
jgi:hypothetical protein